VTGTSSGASDATTTVRATTTSEPAQTVVTTASTAMTATTATTTRTTTTPAQAPLRQVRFEVVDARLHLDGTPSGRQRQNARLTARIKAFSGAATRVTQTVTLRFATTGDATPKMVRDRRARLLIAGQSVQVRVK